MDTPRLFLLCLGFFCLSACNKAPSQTTPISSSIPPITLPAETIASKSIITSTQITTDTALPPSPTRHPPTGTPEKVNSKSPPNLYQISATFDYRTYQLVVQEKIRHSLPEGFQNPLLLIAEPARSKGAFIFNTILVDGVIYSEPIIEGGIIKLNLKDISIQNKATINLEITYSLNVPAAASILGYTKRQINFGDWYPYVPPYVTGQGFLVYPQAPAGEHLNYDIADFAIVITLENAPQSVLVAASSPATQIGNQYTYYLPNSRSFAWSISNVYEVDSQQVGETTIKSYYFPAHQRAGKAALEAAAQAVALYQTEIGQLELPSLAIVEGEFLDGMEYQGLFFLGQEYYYEYTGSPQSYLVPLSAHETAHQWFYGAVANDQAMEPWLDEALCTYMESLFFEKYYPDLLAWWWDYRVLRFTPQGWVNSTVYQNPNFRSYVDAVYLRGALWLDDFRSQIGDKSFKQGLQAYFLENQFKLATANQFFETFRNLGIDLQSDLYSVYFKDQNQ